MNHAPDTPWWTPRRLAIVAVALACTGAWLLTAGPTGAPAPAGASKTLASPATVLGTVRPAAATAAPPPPAFSSATPAPPSSPPASSPAPAPQPGAEQGVAAAGQPAASSASELPPPGSGPAADPIIQQALNRASPPDLPPRDEEQLLAAGRTAWSAETAGYTQVRIQAAIARRDTSAPAAPGGRKAAVVRLVWTGADPAGTLLDGRTATLRYTQNGEGSWERAL